MVKPNQIPFYLTITTHQYHDSMQCATARRSYQKDTTTFAWLDKGCQQIGSGLNLFDDNSPRTSYNATPFDVDISIQLFPNTLYHLHICSSDDVHVITWGLCI